MPTNMVMPARIRPSIDFMKSSRPMNCPCVSLAATSYWLRGAQALIEIRRCLVNEEMGAVDAPRRDWVAGFIQNRFFFH